MHRGDRKIKDFICIDQFLTLAFAQLTFRKSLRDIKGNLRAQSKWLYQTVQIELVFSQNS
jgi:hypothetical protein